MSKPSVYYGGYRSEVTQFLPDRYTKVLEIGCGEGNFLQNLEESCECWGIEPASEAAEKASQRYRVLQGTYDAVYDQLPDRYFDLVICNDVIEHMENHDAFFESIKQKMQPDACLVGSIPNVRHVRNLYNLLIRKDWLYQDSGTLDRTHLRFFTEKSLKRSILEHGFAIDEFQGINSIFDQSKVLNHFWRQILRTLIEFKPFSVHRDIQFLQYGFRAKHVAP